jgi:hypothetical protein
MQRQIIPFFPVVIHGYFTIVTITACKETIYYVLQGLSLLLDGGFFIWYCLIANGRRCNSYVMLFIVCLCVWIGWVCLQMLHGKNIMIHCENNVLLGSVLDVVYMLGAMSIFAIREDRVELGD